MVKDGVLITEVLDNSIAAQSGIEPGDVLLRINGEKLLDTIDYLILTSENTLTIDILKDSGEDLKINIQKEPEESLGLSFAEVVFDGIRNCRNNCLFCFVDQLPERQRDSLYIKDDDYRLSFLQGSYITLTNLSEADWQRIERLRLSPLYISVHATEPLARQKLLGVKKTGNILDHLKRLAQAGINVHTQAVLCPGINDGQILEQTIKDLRKFWPKVESLAIVPVGLTKYGHKDLRPFKKEEAKEVLAIINNFQKRNLKNFNSRFVFAADEWYIIAGQDFPSDDAYEDYPQLDNGVGLVRWFLTEFRDVFSNKISVLKGIKKSLVILTGESTTYLWKEVARNFEEHCPGIKLEILPVKNQFFGPSVNVTGLLGGSDLINAIQSHCLPEKDVGAREGCIYLIPQITLKKDEDVFLDNITVSYLKKSCHPKKVELVPTRAEEWLEWIIRA